MHLAIDGLGAAFDTLRDMEVIRRFLDEYPSTIGMNKIAPPQVYMYRGPVPEDWGVSGFVLIAESHISVHTFPDRGYINIDIFSCKDFDPGPSIAVVRETFSLSDVRVWTLERGVDYSTSAQAQRGMDEERARIVASSGLRDAE